MADPKKPKAAPKKPTKAKKKKWETEPVIPKKYLVELPDLHD
jgi:hypothetical protein